MPISNVVLATYQALSATNDVDTILVKNRGNVKSRVCTPLRPRCPRTSSMTVSVPSTTAATICANLTSIPSPGSIEKLQKIITEASEKTYAEQYSDCNISVPQDPSTPCDDAIS